MVPRRATGFARLGEDLLWLHMVSSLKNAEPLSVENCMSEQIRSSKAAASERVRLTLDLSSRMGAAISAYADRHGLSKADVLRTAMELLLTAERAAEEGMQVGAWKEEDDRRVEREFVGLGVP